MAEGRSGVSRRSFLARASLAAFGAYATVAGVRTPLAQARPSPHPCRVTCQPISDTGCACGGNLYRCSGCGHSFHACVEGRKFRGFCLRRRC